MDFKLTEQEKMIQSMARDFAQRSVKPVAMEIDRACEFPFELAKEMGSMGYFGLPYPPATGALGQDIRDAFWSSSNSAAYPWLPEP
jgi:alkylation response protein AidB-like acyl-CoA dehydrogenase